MIIRTTLLSAAICVVLAGCATQRYGRGVPVSSAEQDALTCDTIKLEIARAEGALDDIRRQRSSTSAAHVFGALGDFGIGNMMEGDAAEQSFTDRLDELRALGKERGC